MTLWEGAELLPPLASFNIYSPMDTDPFLAAQHKVREEQLKSVPAKRLMEKLKDVPTNVEHLKRRWFWELLQNARDAKRPEAPVTVTLDIGPDCLRFTHDGLPFTHAAVENLIKPDSDKDDEEVHAKNIGQFGTGFISTHVLSAVISVGGVVVDTPNSMNGRRFSFALDRTPFTDKEALKANIRRTEDQFDNSLAPWQGEGVVTTFAYDYANTLSNIDGEQVINAGLEGIEATIHYVLALMPEVKQVVILDHRRPLVLAEAVYEVLDRKENEVIVVKRDPARSGVIVWDRHVLLERVGDTSLMVAMAGRSLMPLGAAVPRLFKFLPMIGAEGFSSPVILHSGSWVPRTERDGVEFTPQNEENRAIFSQAEPAFQRLLDRMGELGLKDMHVVARWPSWTLGLPESIKWIQEMQESWGRSLLEHRVVPVHGSLAVLKSAQIPYNEGHLDAKEHYDSLYDILSAFLPTTRPDKEVAYVWAQACSLPWGRTVRYTLKDIAAELAQLGDLGALANSHKLDIEWLHKVLDLLLEYDNGLLDAHALIPDGTGLFRKRSDGLAWPGVLPPQLLSIHLAITGLDFRSKVAHPSLDPTSGFFPHERTLTRKDLAKLIEERFEELDKKTTFEPDEVNAIRDMLKYLDEVDDEARQEFKWLQRHKADLFTKTFSPEQKDQAMAIVQSGKIQELTALANSGISSEDLLFIAANPIQITGLLKRLREDEAPPDEVAGALGEEIVHAELVKKYPAPEFEVIWSSKQDEARFDFEVKRGPDTLLYVDAKTTRTGIIRTDAVPFYVRMSQWQFLQDSRARGRYLLARVFLHGSETDVKWLSVDLKEHLDADSNNN